MFLFWINSVISNFRGVHTCPEPNNAWWGSEIDILEARKFGDFASTNIHYGGYQGKDNLNGTGCYKNSHADVPAPGLHNGFHTLGLRWSDIGGGRLEFFYDGTLTRNDLYDLICTHHEINQNLDKNDR